MAPSVPWQGPFQQSLISLNAISWGRGWANGPLRAHLFEAIILRRPLFGVEHCPHKREDYAMFGGECIWLKDTRNWRRRRKELISGRQTEDPQTSAQCTLMPTQGSSSQYSRAQVWTNQFAIARKKNNLKKEATESAVLPLQWARPSHQNGDWRTQRRWSYVFYCTKALLCWMSHCGIGLCPVLTPVVFTHYRWKCCDG